MTRITMRESMANVAYDGRPRKIANNTFKYDRDGSTFIRLHLTDIIEEMPDGRVRLNTGGWQTVTTKDRLNSFAPCRVYSDRGVWYVDHAGKTAPFFDGMILPDDMDKGDKTAKQSREQIKAINAFVAKIDELPKLPMPNNGDCWFCALHDNGKAWGEDQRDHLQSHIDEGYLHGSLLVNAMRWAGYRDEGIGAMYQMDLRDTFKRTLRRYLKRKLGLAA